VWRHCRTDVAALDSEALVPECVGKGHHAAAVRSVGHGSLVGPESPKPGSDGMTTSKGVIGVRRAGATTSCKARAGPPVDMRHTGYLRVGREVWPSSLCEPKQDSGNITVAAVDVGQTIGRTWASFRDCGYVYGRSAAAGAQ